MRDLGTVDRAFFDRYIDPHLGADREDVVLGPAHGVDFGAVTVGDRTLAMATDPLFVLPSLGVERAAWFAFHALCSDVVLSGLPPAYLSVDFNLPPETTDEQFETVWRTFDREARDLGVAVVTGHTARYEGCAYPMVGGGTAMAVGDPDDLVRPDGARVGDRVLVTKGPAIEATALLAAAFGTETGLDGATIDAATARLDEMSPVRDAMVAAAAGPVTAMHDATAGGVVGGLMEMARAAGVGIAVERERIPVRPGVRETCAAVDIDPWTASSRGTLLATVDPEGVGDVLAALDEAGIPAADAGEVVEGSGLRIDGEAVESPGADPFWAAFEAGLAERES